jgi:hypothetical protein
MKYIFIIIVFILSNCYAKDRGRPTTGPVLSLMFNNRMLVLIKATYSSDNPIDFADYNNKAGTLYQDDTGDGKDPTHDLQSLPTASNLPIYVDIGEVRLSSNYSKGLNELSQIKDAKDSSRFWDYVAPNRTVICSAYYTISPNRCQDSNGIFLYQDMMNGTGAKLDMGDTTSESIYNGTTLLGTQYYYAGLYFRNITTAWAADNGLLLTSTNRFDNFRVAGINIVPRSNYVPNTTATDKQTKVPLMFPLLYQVKEYQKDLEIRGGIDPYILEYRFNLKENLMVHTYTTTRGTIQTFVGISDWKYNHSGEIDVGGNMLGRARVIFPEEAAKLKIRGGTGDLSYSYAVYRRGETDILNRLPVVATPARTGDNDIKYIMPGDYTLYCVGDVSRKDGYPDTIIRNTDFSIPAFSQRKEILVELSCN